MKKGDIVYVDYDVRIKESGDYFKTTRMDVAKENDLYDEKRVYGPIPVVVGTGFESVGFDSTLLDMEIGNEKEVEVSEDDGHGKRDPKLIDLVPMRTVLKLPQFKEGESYPMPGMPVRIGNKEGYIRTVGAGRVRVDFNHPLAGKELLYNINISKKAETDEELVNAIFDIHYPIRTPPAIDMGEENVKIILPEMCKYDQAWQGVKFMIIAALREHLSVKSFQLIEEYKEHRSVVADDIEHEHEDNHDHDQEHEHEDDVSAEEGEKEEEGGETKE